MPDEMRILLTAVGGFVLDLLLGDPAALTPIHPVVLMGRCIQGLENLLRRIFPATERGEFHAGLILVLLMALGTPLLCFVLLRWLDRVFPPASAALELIWCWQALAVKNLRDEAMRVYRALTEGSLEQARRAVARIVGRDTTILDHAGVTRAAVVTVAENFSDGVAAPLFYMLLGGAPLALCYKAINTMDSMLGYKTGKYLFFGRAAARLDDAANYLPARLAALLLIAACFPAGENAEAAFRIWRRDRRRHESPNSAQCEAAMAGALGLRLCGPAVYFGELHEKPWIGDEGRPITAEDIRRACRLEVLGSILALAVFGGLRWICLVV